MTDKDQILKQQMIAGMGGSILLMATTLTRWPLDVANVVLITLGAFTGGYCWATLRLLSRGELVIRQPTSEEEQNRMRSRAIVMVIVALVAAFCLVNILRK